MNTTTTTTTNNILNEITNQEQDQEQEKRNIKRLKHLQASSKHYLKKVQNNPESRKVFNERAKQARLKQNGGIIKPKGRPRKLITEPKIKRKIGRPLKYIMEPTSD